MRKRETLVIISLTVALLVVVVPYLVPVSYPAEVSSQSLVTSSGRFLDVSSDRIYVEEQGPPSLNAVVLLHGFGGSTFSWRGNVSFLASEGYHVVALDLRGFGLSSRDPQSDYSHKAQANLVAEVLQRLGIARAYLIGHSMGSSVMFHFAHLHPEMVLGLISVDGAVNLKPGSRLPSMLLAFPPFRRAARVFLTRYVSKDRFASILESAYHSKEVVSSDVIQGYYDRAIRSGWDESLLAMTRDMPRNVIDFPLESIEFRTLVIRGEEDTWVSQAEIDRWKNRVPNAVFYGVPDSGHLPMEERPAVFNQIVLDFLHSTRN
jgi:pimeloyl-ACP methyl ester carboxylesterase